MTELRSAAVVGLGLIGGSLARDLAGRGVRVLGGDRDPEAVRAALREGIVHAGLGPAGEGVEEAEVVVLAVPVSTAPELLAALLSRLGGARLVTDVGSTKRGIVAAAEALGVGARFVGSHPLAGDHRSGWSASRAGLFSDARVFLTPGPSSGEEALARARALWTGVGAHVEQLPAEEHDGRLAWTSHLPQAASTALARALAGAGIPRSELGRGGRDVTRLAGSSPEMWTAIALDNAAFLAEAIDALHGRLGELRGALLRGDAAAVREFFSAAREWSDREVAAGMELAALEPPCPGTPAGHATRSPGGQMDRNQRSDRPDGSPEISRERSPEDGMQGVAEERERMGGYGYDSPADLEEAEREQERQDAGRS